MSSVHLAPQSKFIKYKKPLLKSKEKSFLPKQRNHTSGTRDAFLAWIYFWFAKKDFVYRLKHPFHLVERSLLPIFTCIFLSLNLGYLVCYTYYQTSLYSIAINISLLAFLLSFLFTWLFDVHAEEKIGFHTLEVQFGFQLGIIFFIVSEIMLFVSFFWSFFHFSLSPAVSIGLCWPMEGLPFFAWNKIPLINTLLLLSSGIDITISHKTFYLWEKELKRQFWSKILFILPNFSNRIARVLYQKISLANFLKRTMASAKFTNNFNYFSSYSRQFYTTITFIFFTLLRGFIFLICQYIEYFFSPFSITDGVYGSVFFMSTGLHGLHVIIGFSALLYCAFLKKQIHDSGYYYWEHSVGFNGSIWYWHFVDVVWLFLFLVIYWWSSN